MRWLGWLQPDGFVGPAVRGRFTGILEAAGLADRMGVDLLVLPDHVTISEQAHRDGWSSASGTIEHRLVRPLTALAAVAGVILPGPGSAPTSSSRRSARPCCWPSGSPALDVICGGPLDVDLGRAGRRRSTGSPSGCSSAASATWRSRSPSAGHCRPGTGAAHVGQRAGFHRPVQHAGAGAGRGPDLRLSFGFHPHPAAIERVVRYGLGGGGADAVEEVRAAVAAIRAECVRVGGIRPRSGSTDAATTPVTHGRTAEEAALRRSCRRRGRCGGRCRLRHRATPWRSCGHRRSCRRSLQPLLDARDARFTPRRPP